MSEDWEIIVQKAIADAERIYPAVARDSEEARQAYDEIIRLESRIKKQQADGGSVELEAVAHLLALKSKQHVRALAWLDNRRKYMKWQTCELMEGLCKAFPQGMKAVKGHANQRHNLEMLLEEYDVLVKHWAEEEVCLWEDSQAQTAVTAITNLRDEICR